MMRKLLLSFAIISAFGINLAIAQCTPDPLLNNPGIYPDSATNLPHAIAGTAYSTVMTAVIPADTLYGGFTIPITDITLTGITGLPAGFTYAANPGSGVFPGNSKACVLFTGNPTVAQVGTYPLTVSLTAHAAGLSQPTTLTYYKIVIDPATGISVVKDYRFELLQNTPNPFSNTTNIVFSTPFAENITFSVMNIVGKTVHTETIEATTGENKILFNSSDLPSGIYVYQINNGKQTITKRMIVNK